VQLRHEVPDDAAAIGFLTTEAFASAPVGGGNEADIVAGLRAAGALAISLVAEEDGRLVGHAAFSAVSVAGAAGPWFGLGPVSVTPSRQGQGIGGALILRGVRELRAAGAAGCVVLGDPAFYGRFGFTHDPDLRYGDTGAHFQRLVFAGDAPSGEVRYHPAFG